MLGSNNGILSYTLSTIAETAGTTVITIASGQQNILTSLDSTSTLINWQSAQAVNKSQIIPAADASNSGYHIIIKDGIGTAEQYPITVAASSGTIDEESNFIIYENKEAIELISDGNGNWLAT